MNPLRVFFLAALGALVTLGGCMPRQILLGQDFATTADGTTKSFKSIKRKSPTKPGYYDDVIRVCDVNALGEELNCVDTLIVQTVMQ